MQLGVNVILTRLVSSCFILTVVCVLHLLFLVLLPCLVTWISFSWFPRSLFLWWPVLFQTSVSVCWSVCFLYLCSCLCLPLACLYCLSFLCFAHLLFPVFLPWRRIFWIFNICLQPLCLLFVSEPHVWVLFLHQFWKLARQWSYCCCAVCVNVHITQFLVGFCSACSIRL